MIYPNCPRCGTPEKPSADGRTSYCGCVTPNFRRDAYIQAALTGLLANPYHAERNSEKGLADIAVFVGCEALRLADRNRL